MSRTTSIGKFIVKNTIVVKDLDLGDEKQRSIYDMRVSKCRECEHNTNQGEDSRCKICKCYIDLKTKSLVNRNIKGQKEITHCPRGKWNDELLYKYLKSITND